MFFHHFTVTVLCCFKQKPFRVNHHLMKSRFGHNPSNEAILKTYGYTQEECLSITLKELKLKKNLE